MLLTMAPIDLSLGSASGIVDGEGTSVDVDGIVIAIRITVKPGVETVVAADGTSVAGVLLRLLS